MNTEAIIFAYKDEKYRLTPQACPPIDDHNGRPTEGRIRQISVNGQYHLCLKHAATRRKNIHPEVAAPSNWFQVQGKKPLNVGSGAHKTITGKSSPAPVPSVMLEHVAEVSNIRVQQVKNRSSSKHLFLFFSVLTISPIVHNLR